MKTINIGNTREVCWDDFLVEEFSGAYLKMHKPVRKNLALTCDDKWEGSVCGQLEVHKIGGKIYLYYRASGLENLFDESFCVAVSDDGVNFTKPNLGKYDYNGIEENNIFLREERFIDNFSVHYDEHPACPENEKYKALSLWVSNEFTVTELALYVSGDGINFNFKKKLDIKGVFDTTNVLIWDKDIEMYRLYVRDFHSKIDGSDVHYEPTEAMEKATRDIRLSFSKDLETFTHPERLRYQEDAEDIELYTNHIVKYHRGNIFVGFPTRYINRVDDIKNFKYLSKWGGLRQEYIEKGNRIGTVATDCVLMTSRDGLNFTRHDEEAFITPGLESETNWVYGDCYPSFKFVETPIEGNEGKTELSFYMPEGYRAKTVEVIRFSVRLDGFFSWRGDFKGGSVLTKPITFEGDSMEINFATSALGSVRVEICDLDGNPIEGYDSGILFGDSLNRPVEFEKSLKELSGKEIKIKFSLKDADLYSFKFN